MELYLQFGYGMMEHCRALIAEWGAGTVILSPRDLSREQMVRLSGELREDGGSVMVDPQFYVPDANHGRLTSHDYWPENYSTGEFWSGGQLRDFMAALLQLNLELGCRDLILPGLHAETVTDDWLQIQRLTFEEVVRHDIDRFQLIATIALSAKAVRDVEQVHRILDEVNNWDVGGFYVVCQHPPGEYLVTDASWITNVLDLAAGLRLKGKRVIVGYCSHQLLVTACADVEAIASGTWVNVRSFPPEKFQASLEDEIKQKAIWYYCPQALSEYRLSYLDIAKRTGVLDRMRPPADLGSGYADELFSAPQPSVADFSQQKAFRHYLQCLRGQARSARHATFDETMRMQMSMLDNAAALLAELSSSGVRGQHRDFSEIVDANRAALLVLDKDRGAVMRRYWSNV